jgi:BirA family biotin operon repressor/biotin-[acetyl-CoA-carboxylase] ligase
VNGASAYNVDELGEALRALRFKLHYFPRLASTNDQAAEMRRAGDLFAPAVVVTGEQVTGRGRGANTWFSNQGVMTATFVFPAEEGKEGLYLPLLSGLAVRHAAAALSGDAGVQLKWPNDIYYGGRKLAGLLCERVSGADLVGVGLNVNLDAREAPAELAGKLTSLMEIAGRPIGMNDALLGVAGQLRRMMERRDEVPVGVLLCEYDEYHLLKGRRVVVSGAGKESITGVCQGIGPMGSLLVMEGERFHSIYTGHVEVI